ncbi:ABC transporter permease subunit [Mesorhizobium sp. M0808]|uniref:sulfate ABC transporter permease n=2 Tax=unclassified Mesorhizobium TaxID=325217 RepID=UPI00333BF6AE
MSAEAILEKPRATAPARSIRRAQQDPAWVRWLLTGAALAIVIVLIVIPVTNIFVQALSEGVMTYWRNLFDDPDTRHSIVLTLIVAPIALVANTVFGVAAAWAIAKFNFRGRTLLTALIDLPFAVSPVVAGLMFVLIFGRQGYLGPFLRADGYSIMPYLISALAVGIFILLFYILRPLSPKARRGLWNHPYLVLLLGSAIIFGVLFYLQVYFEVWPRNQSLKIIFALPGLVLATAFITFPFVARELIPVMEAVGVEEELAAVSLGASGWQLFWHITVPNIKWGLIYGVILCNARAMGEFGAVYVVSGHIAGQTDTMPLRIEKLFQEYNLPGSFAVASLLTLVAIITLIAKVQLDRRAPNAASVPARTNGVKP